MIDCFEVMYEEGADHPKLMSLALHDRLTGRPRPDRRARHVPRSRHRPRPRVDLHRREIAEHWRRVHPPEVPHACSDVVIPRESGDLGDIGALSAAPGPPLSRG